MRAVDKLIILILLVAIIYILYLYFRCKKLEKIKEAQDKKIHDAAIILSAHKTVLINKVIRLNNDKRDIRIINRELDEEIAECCAYMIEHEEELINKANGEHIVKIDKEDK